MVITFQAMALKVVLAALFLLALMMASQASSRGLNGEVSMIVRHERWMALYGRVYKDEAEKADRYKIFKENVEFIDSFNRAGAKSYKLGINQFADLTNEEFKAQNKYKPWKVCESKSFMYENVSAVPAAMDWRKKGAVTGVKDQGQCGKSINYFGTFSVNQIL